MKTLSDFAKEDYELSENGSVQQALVFLLNYHGVDHRDDVTIKWIRKFLDFAEKRLEDETMELRRFRSPDWTWASLCGREGFVIVDKDGGVVDSYLYAMS